MYSSPLLSFLPSGINSLLLGLFTPAIPKSLTNSVQERKRYQEAPPEEVIAQLQIARDNLVLKKTAMERKIAGFHEKKRIKDLEAQKLQEDRHQQQQQNQEQKQQPR